MATGYFPPSGGGGGASDECTATAADVLNGYTAITSDGDDPTEGTMSNYASQSASGSVSWANNTVEYSMPAGYYNTESSIAVPASTFGNAVAANVKSGATFTSSDGLKITGTMTTKAATALNPGQSVSATTYMTGALTIAGNSNLTAGNIKKGVSIFGVAGSFYPGSSMVKAGQTLTSSSSTKSFTKQGCTGTGSNAAFGGSESSTTDYYISISNLGFTPSYMYYVSSGRDSMGSYYFWCDGYIVYQHKSAATSPPNVIRYKKTGNLTFTSSSVCVPFINKSQTVYYWLG